ncbi:hypothetical protein [Spirosoma luteolum]
MKKTIVAALAFFALTTGSTFAQRVYERPYDNRPGYNAPRSQYNDDFRDELKIERLDALVGLSRRQEKQLRRIEENYDRLFATSRMTPQGYRDAQLRKREEVMSVLTRSQRERLFAYQQQNTRPGNNGRGYNNGGYYGGRRG